MQETTEAVPAQGDVTGTTTRLVWLREFGEALSPHTLVIAVYSLGVGAVSGFVALGLLKLIYLLTWAFFYGRYSWQIVSPAGNHLGLWMVAIPALGGGAVGLMIHFWEPSLKGHGIPEAMQAVLLDKSVVRGRVAFLKPLATALAIGSGGPFGAEGPIIQTGAALGSLLAQRLRLRPYDRRVLLAAGAAAGMSATFLAPLAGIMVAIELILFEYRARSFIPVALASATAAAVSMHFRGSGPMFAMPLYQLGSLHELWLFGILGVGVGFLGLALTKVLFWLEDLFDLMPLPPAAVWSPMLGGLLLGCLALLYPQVLGTGYDTIRHMLNGQFTWRTSLGVSGAKFWALVISLGSGTTGGVFAPSLIVGGGFGIAFSVLCHHLFPHLTMASAGLYSLTAMAALFGCIARAPFSAIVFLFELSQNPHAVLPLVVTCMVADAAMRLFSAESIMTGKLARRGVFISQDYSTMEFLHTQVIEIMTPIVQSLPADATLESYRSKLPPDGRVALVDARGELAGLLDPKRIPSEDSSNSKPLRTFAEQMPVKARAHDSVGVLVRAMLRNRTDHAVVVSETTPAQPLGLVNIADVWALQRSALDPSDHAE